MPFTLFVCQAPLYCRMKKKPNKRRTSSTPSPYWAAKQAFDDALRLQHKGHSRDAWKILKPHAEGDQSSVPILELYIDVCDSLKDSPGVFFAAERLTRQREEMLDFVALLKASFELHLPAHLHHALTTLRKNWPGKFPIPEEESLREIGQLWMQEALPDIQKRFPELQDVDFMELMLLHEKSMQDIGSQRFEHATEMLSKIVRRFPYFTLAYNNLALARVQSLGFAKAAEAIDAALEHDPESLFALSLKARQFEISDQKEEMEQTLKMIGEIVRKKEMIPTELTFGQLATAAEAFASQDRRDEIQWIYEKALDLKRHVDEELAGEDRDNFGLIVHLSAVALAKQGKTSEAEKRWNEARRYSTIDIIGNNLSDLKKAAGMRNGPWYVEFRKMIPAFAFDILSEAAGRILDDGVDEAIVARDVSRKIAAICPDFHRYLIKALWDGGLEARNFIRVFGLRYGHPELIQAMIAFCETPLGTDDYRQVMTNRLLNERHLKPGPATRWIKGEKTDVILCLFRITRESRIDGVLPPKAEKGVAHAFDLMSRHQYAEAVEAFEKILLSVPQYPAAHYNYAACLLLLKEKERYRKVIEDICRRFPDYSFGIGAKAGFLLGEGKLEEAEKLIDHLMRMEEHHISAYRMLINLVIALEIAEREAGRRRILASI